MPTYPELVTRRRSLAAAGFATLADVGFDGEWITPYQICSRSPDGLALVAHHWLDAPSVDRYREHLARGYLARMAFNKVLERALATLALGRGDIYVTQVFHLLPMTRCNGVSRKLVDASFDAVTRHELIGRRVIAMGVPAADACRRHGVRAFDAPHPSARTGSYDARAAQLAAVMRQARG